MKRIFDFMFALAGLIISLPLWLIFGLLIWMEDRGPIFYTQDRVGKDGSMFKSMKFRSMMFSSKGKLSHVQAVENDPRITRIGKFLRATAMDELPQLINILKGEMSFVGPRALVPVEQEIGAKKEKSIFDLPGFSERSSIKPGLTGVAQVLVPRDVNRLIKFKYDIWYVRNQNLGIDIEIVLLSFLITFMGKWETRDGRFTKLVKRHKYRVESESRDIVLNGQE